VTTATTDLLVVYRDDANRLRCNEFGAIHTAVRSTLHRVGNRRACVHVPSPLPHTMFFSTSWLAQFDWRSVIVERDYPCIASRTGDILTMAFDAVGPVTGCRNKCRDVPEHRWAYRLHPFRWWDDDNPCDTAYLGVWPD
jgi:hypothetical protein